MESQQRQVSVATFDGLPDLMPLPENVVTLLESVSAASILCAHLRLVYDTSRRLTSWVQARFPEVELDADLVAFGAATHDIGKALHPRELSEPGRAHEESGQSLLVDLGVSPHAARFAVTHNDWTTIAITIEDLLVAVADKVWKARREDDLETRLVDALSLRTGREPWEVFAALDEELELLAALADQRLAFQGQWGSA